MITAPFAAMLALALVVGVGIGSWIRWMYWQGGFILVFTHWFQRATRGYSKCDLWGLYQPLAKHILSRLKAFKAMKRHGHPIIDGFAENQWEAEWERILDEMIFAFQWVVDDEEQSRHYSGMEEWFKRERNANERVRKGLELFGKYFLSLWD